MKNPNTAIALLLSLLISTGTASASSFTVVGSLNHPRNEHAATLLVDGRVLVSGGLGQDFDTSTGYTTELFDPVAQVWSVGPSMAVSRYQHTSTLLPDGRVLVTGGGGPGGLTPVSATVEIFDPVSNGWSSAPSMKTARAAHTATLLTNGLVLVAGDGTLGNTNTPTAELYDPVGNFWTNTGPMTMVRSGHTATLLPNGQVLVTGGQGTNSFNALSNACIFTLSTGVWTNTGPMHLGRYGHTATLLGNGKVLVAGGVTFSNVNATELFDPGTGTWSYTGPLKYARRYHEAAALPNGMVLVAGGMGTNSSYPTNAELYDPSSQQWFITAALHGGREEFTATSLAGGSVLAAGGDANAVLSDRNLPFSDSEVYDGFSPPITVVGCQILTNGAFQLTFTNTPAQSFSVVASVDPSAPTSGWPYIGSTKETSSGQYQFTDLQATNHPQRFYQVRSP